MKHDKRWRTSPGRAIQGPTTRGGSETFERGRMKRDRCNEFSFSVSRGGHFFGRTIANLSTRAKPVRTLRSRHVLWRT